MIVKAKDRDKTLQAGDTVRVQLDDEAYAECVVVEPITDHSYIVRCVDDGELLTFVAV